MAYPTLNQNAVYTALYNQVVGISVEGKNIANTHASLLNAMKIDVSRFGDSKVFIDTDILESYDFVQDSEDARNVLAVKRATPAQTIVTLDKARQIMVTLDDFGISSKAFGSAESFAAFNGVVLSWVSKTKECFEAMYFNVYAGTTKATGAAQNIEVNGDDAATLAQAAAKAIADLLVEMSVPCRDYNDKGLMRSFDKEDLVIVWNSKYLSQIRDIDVPVLFGGDKLMPSVDYTLAPRYFGEMKTSGGTVGAGAKIRTAVEKTYASGHKYPGELLATGDAYSANEAYEEKDDIVCKVIGKGALPFLTGVSTGTEFVNGRNNSTNHYLTWTYGIGRLDAKPLVTVKKAA